MNESTNDTENSENDEFSKLLISTTTVTTKFKNQVNIIDVAKYLPLDDVIIGIKLVYSGGNSIIIRGISKQSKKKKDFYNQVTFTMRLPLKLLKMKNPYVREHRNDSILISCKVFHNGTLHITGTHSLEESQLITNLLLERLVKFKGIKMITLNNAVSFLNSFDNLIFSVDGRIIGWNNGDLIFLNTEYVNLEVISFECKQYEVFVSSKWVNKKKTIYSLGGDIIGKKILSFSMDISKRHFDVKYGYIYAGNKIVGKEEFLWLDNFESHISKFEECAQVFRSSNVIVHPYVTFYTINGVRVNSQIEENQLTGDYKVHMINTFFKAPFNICRIRLHKTFQEKGLYSRFDPCTNSAVNLRFHYHEKTIHTADCGKCPHWIQRESIKVLNCECKEISVSCFNSGKMNVTGLDTLTQGQDVYKFLIKFFSDNKQSIIQKILD